MNKLKICIRPKDCKKWSDEFKVSALKLKLECDRNIMWNHYKTYSILRKESTEHKDVFDYKLMPAMIIKNCLPMPIMMVLLQEQKTEAERKANMRTELLDVVIASVASADPPELARRAKEPVRTARLPAIRKVHTLFGAG